MSKVKQTKCLTGAFNLTRDCSSETTCGKCWDVSANFVGTPGIRLNLGSGKNPLPGYVNVDRSYDVSRDGNLASGGLIQGASLIKADVYPLYRLDGGVADEIRASHILEHFPHSMTLDILKDWTRVLAPGGRMKIAVPDFAFIAEAYINKTDGVPVELYCMGGQVDENDFHKAIFDGPTLRRMLYECGLVDVQPWTSEIADCAALPVSLNLMGRKPFEGEEIVSPSEMTADDADVGHVEIEGWHPVQYCLDDILRSGNGFKRHETYKGFGLATRLLEPEELHGGYARALIIAPDWSVAESDKEFNNGIDEARNFARETIDSILDTAGLVNHPDRRYAGTEIAKGVVYPVLTCPRLGFTAFMHCALLAFQHFGSSFEMFIQSGAYWNQGIETLCEGAVKAGAKYVLTFDYDTVFDYRDIEVLYGIMEDCPEIGALCPIQMRREVQTALFTVKGADGQNVAQLDSALFSNDIMRIASGHLGLTMIRVECLKSTPKPWLHAVPTVADGKTSWVDADVAFWMRFQEAGHTICLANRVCIGHLELHATWPDRNLEPIVQQVSDYYAAGKPKKGSGIWV